MDKERYLSWGKKGSEVKETIGELFKRVSLTDDEYTELVIYSKSVGIELFATPFHTRIIPFLEALGVTRYKVASSDLSYLDLLHSIAQTKKPIILRTLQSSSKIKIAMAVGKINVILLAIVVDDISIF